MYTMSDRKRALIIVVISILVLSIYYYIGDIGNFANSITSGEIFSKLATTSGRIIEEKVVREVVSEEDAVIDVVDKSTSSVVSIVRKEVYFDIFDGPTRSENSIGTGFIVDGENWIVLTNKHVVDSEEASYSVITADEETYDVENVYRDPINDFAILKINKDGNENKTLDSIPLGDSDILKVGQSVVAIGNALGEFGNSVTKGVISGLKRGITARSGAFGRAEMLEDVIQTDAALNPGNSGGPLLNLAGEVVGINVAVSQGAQNLGFAIPINTLKPVIEQFNKDGKISRPYLGVEYMQITKDIAERRSLPVGAFVRNVVPGSPANKAGLKTGDIILRLNKIQLNDEDNTLAKVISRQQTGKEITMLVDRNGREITMNVRLEDLSGD